MTLSTCNSDNTSKIQKIIDGGYCIGCGACSVNNKNHEIYENSLGLYQARIISPSEQINDDTCPFASEQSESDLGKKLFEDNSKFDTRIGFYKEIYAGHVTEDEYRKNGSSGGLVTWVLSQLFSSGEIDGVIHVGETNNPGNLFEYKISETLEDIRQNSKSRYYPVHIDEVIKQIKSEKKRYAFVGVPCFVKAIRLLADSDTEISENIKYCIAIFCGHFKTKFFAEMIAWQQHINPPQLTTINFRFKNKNRPANQYSVQATKKEKELIKPAAPTLTRDLYGMDWGLGYFKPKACDWCDDIAGETADLACGDAWLPEFIQQSDGTNIAIIRHHKISEIIKDGITKGKLNLISQSVDKVYASQAGNYRHRQEGLSVRIQKAKQDNIWHPKKRINEKTYSISEKRRSIYLLRSHISETSQKIFYQAKNKNNFTYFFLKMLPLEIKYHSQNNQAIKGTIKSVISYLKYLRRGTGI